MHLSGQSIDDSFDECLEIVLKSGLSANAMAIEALSRHLDIRTMLKRITAKELWVCSKHTSKVA